MSLRSIIADELKRSPVATFSAAGGVVIAALTLALAWLQYRGAAPTVPAATVPVSPSPNELFLGNMFLNIAYFLGATIADALLLRAIARKHGITAFFASIPLVAFSNFIAILLIYLAPPRPVSPQLFAAAHDLVFYASAAIVAAFCGKDVLNSIASTGEKESTVGGDLFMAFLLLTVWCSLVYAGETRLTRTLLPEVTYPAVVKPSMQPNNGLQPSGGAP